MSRTDQEFKAEVLRRTEAYRQRQKQRRRTLINAALCVVLVIGGWNLVSPFFAMGGSSAPLENGEMADMVVMSPEGTLYGSTEGPAAVVEQSISGESKSTAEPEELLPMVMIDGVIYLDTGVSNDDVKKCGTFDGQITSQVPGSPTEDDQSNFGVGYGYQYGKTEGTVEIYMNGKWWIFATEEVRAEIQSPE